jgi:flavin-binding protein dodecin
MSVLKVVEIMSDSTKSWEDATEKGIQRASKTVKNIKSAYVQEQSVTVSDNNVKSFRVNLKVSFAVD